MDRHVASELLIREENVLGLVFMILPPMILLRCAIRENSQNHDGQNHAEGKQATLVSLARKRALNSGGLLL